MCFYSIECTEGASRIMDGSVDGEGRVEYCFGGRWGAVCDGNWGPPEAAVVCRQNGFSTNGRQPTLTHSFHLLTHSLTYSLNHSLTYLSTHSLTLSLIYSPTHPLTRPPLLQSIAVFAYHDSHFGGGTTLPVWLANVRCNGQEASLQNCTYNRVGSGSCSTHNRDAGVRCLAGSESVLKIVNAIQNCVSLLIKKVEVCNFDHDY